MYLIAEDELFHYGTPRHSGRYPWGSGEDPYQHGGGFLGAVNTMHKSGMSESEIAEALGMSIRDLRARKSVEKNNLRSLNPIELLHSRRRDGRSPPFRKSLVCPFQP